MSPAEVGALRRHIEAAFDRCDVQVSPFPHLVIADFFPANVYAEILELNPFRETPGSEWLPREASSNVSARTPYHARKQIDLTPAGLPGIPQAARGLFGGLRDCILTDDWFARLVVRKYPEYFQLRFGDLLSENDFYALMQAQLFLQRHEPGFRIGPHTDLPTRIFTCIFSFAERDGFDDFGTQLLAHRDRLVRCWGADHHPEGDFVIRKVVPYRPNTFLLFFKTRHSFHAVTPIDEQVPNQRYGMQYQFHEPAGGVFEDLSAPDLMEFPRRAAAPTS
jgi:hypothetical protein